MLERMGEFFDSRLEGYEEHQLSEIEQAREFYPYTAECLPRGDVRILDLGCGTGLELGYYYALEPRAHVTGIDLAKGMLRALGEKFAQYEPELIHGSYFDVPFGMETYDAAVSVESLHHFTAEQKLQLYTRLHDALREGGYFILTDFFALDDENERLFMNNYLEAKRREGIEDDELYHYDTPLTSAHEMKLLHEAGFSQVERLKAFGATETLKAVK